MLHSRIPRLACMLYASGMATTIVAMPLVVRVEGSCERATTDCPTSRILKGDVCFTSSPSLYTCGQSSRHSHLLLKQERLQSSHHSLSHLVLARERSRRCKNDNPRLMTSTSSNQRPTPLSAIMDVPRTRRKSSSTTSNLHSKVAFETERSYVLQGEFGAASRCCMLSLCL